MWPNILLIVGLVWFTVGVLVALSLDGERLIEPHQVFTAILGWPWAARRFFEPRPDSDTAPPDLQRSRHWLRGHAAAVEAVRDAATDLPGLGILVGPHRAVIAKALTRAKAAGDTAIGGACHADFVDGFLAAEHTTTTLLARARDTEADGEMAFVPLASDLLRALGDDLTPGPGAEPVPSAA